LAAEALVLSVVARRWWPQVLVTAGLALLVAFLKPDQGESAWHSFNLFALAATAFVQAGRRRWEGLTWLGSGLVLAGIVHLLIPRFPEMGPPLGILASLLIHATLMQLTALFIRWRWPQGVEPFAIPLGQSALVPLVLALPMLLVQIEPGEMHLRARRGTPLGSPRCGWRRRLANDAVLCFRCFRRPCLEQSCLEWRAFWFGKSGL
jgi:hypothetical protein